VEKLPPNCSQNAYCITKNKIAKSIPALEKERSATKLLLSKRSLLRSSWTAAAAAAVSDFATKLCPRRSVRIERP
jgi:hypothetical protein